MGQRTGDQRGDAQRLGGDPHRLAARPAGEVVGVGVEGVEVDDRDRGGQRLGVVRRRRRRGGPTAGCARRSVHRRWLTGSRASSAAPRSRPSRRPPRAPARGRGSTRPPAGRAAARGAGPRAASVPVARPSWRSRRTPASTISTTPVPASPIPAHVTGLRTRPVAQSVTEPAISVNISRVPVRNAATGSSVKPRARIAADRAPSSEGDPRPRESQQGQGRGERRPGCLVHPSRVPQWSTEQGE